jgi:hypothetical protein
MNGHDFLDVMIQVNVTIMKKEKKEKKRKKEEKPNPARAPTKQFS